MAGISCPLGCPTIKFAPRRRQLLRGWHANLFNTSWPRSSTAAQHREGVMAPVTKRMKFEHRYVITAQLVLDTSLHIGGGRATAAPTDSPVIRGPDLKPFIPGSSFKGAFRNTVEKLAWAVGLHSCGLAEDGRCPG